MTIALLELPESVFTYLTDRRVRKAVDDILDEPELPDGLSWDEIPTYYRALLSAYATQSDYIETLSRAWEAIWGMRFAGLEHLSPDDLTDENWLAPGTELFWDQGSYGRGFRERRPRRALIFVSVSLEAINGLRIGYRVFDAGSPVDVAAEGFAMESEEMMSPGCIVQSGYAIDLSELTRFASIAESAILSRS